jgi:hypothetical protein
MPDATRSPLAWSNARKLSVRQWSTRVIGSSRW